VTSSFYPTGASKKPGGAPTGAARALSLVERFFLAAGVVLFVVLVARIGVDNVWANLRLIGWGFVIIIGQEMLALIVNAIGWRHAFPHPQPAPPFAKLLAARVAGDSINYVTPTATLGGEFVRARMIDDVAEQTAVWASVAVAKITQTVAQLVFIIAGLLFVVVGTPLPIAVRHTLLVSVPLFAATIAGTVALQRHGLFTTAVRFLHRLRLPVPARAGERLRRLDDEIRRVYAAPSSFFLSTAWFLLGWMCGILEIYVILYFLGLGTSWSRAFTIEALSVTIDGLLFFVPAKAGTEEGSKVLIFTLLGLDPAKGLTLGIVRRIRELTWAGVGLLVLSRWHLLDRGGVTDGQTERLG